MNSGDIIGLIVGASIIALLIATMVTILSLGYCVTPNDTITPSDEIIVDIDEPVPLDY